MTNIIIFTDGSFSRKAKTCGCGVYFPNSEIKNISVPFKLHPLTSQRTELYAIYIALYKIIKNVKFDKITVYSDSMYSINSLTNWIYKWDKNEWIGTNKKSIKNIDILKKLLSILKKYGRKIEFFHVKSHTKKTDFYSLGNKYADELAKKGALLSRLE